MKVLLIFPPIWDINLAPMLSMPTLSGMLTKEGHDVKVFDMNSAFMNFVLSKDFLTYFDNKVKFYTQELFKLECSNKENNINVIEYIKKIIKTFHSIKGFLNSFYNQYPDIKSRIDDICKLNAKDLTNKYNQLRNIVNKIFSLNLDNNIPFEYTLLYDWECKTIKEFSKYNPDFICISLYYGGQYLYIEHFTKFLKLCLNKPVILGGSWITYIMNNISSDIFESVDICIYGEGEFALKSFIDNVPKKDIPNIIYFENNNIKINPKKKIDVPKFYHPNYSGINLSEYFIPRTVIPVESSRGCYWNKCEFCDFPACMPYKQKNVNDLIEEIKEYTNKYDIHHLFFTDTALHPLYAEEFSRKILENDLKIYYVTFLRLEKEFNKELLNLMYKAGLRIAMWGLESGSDKILKKYNKGTTSQKNAEILKISHNTGIFNYCWVIIDFPTETIEDIDLTKTFLENSYNDIDYIHINNFTFLPNSLMLKHPKDFGLENNNLKLLKHVDYNPPEEIKRYSDKVFYNISEKYRQKLEYYPKDISILLLKVSEEKP